MKYNYYLKFHLHILTNVKKTERQVFMKILFAFGRWTMFLRAWRIPPKTLINRFFECFSRNGKKHDLSGFSCARLFSVCTSIFYKTICSINLEILQLRRQKKFEISAQVHIKNSRFLTQISGSKTALHNLQRRWIWLRRCIKVWRQIGQGPFISIFHSGGF